MHKKMRSQFLIPGFLHYIIWSALRLGADDGEVLSLLCSIGEGHWWALGDGLAISNDAELTVYRAYPAMVYWLEARHTEAAHFDVGLRAWTVVLYGHTVLWLTGHNPIRVLLRDDDVWQLTTTLGITCKYASRCLLLLKMFLTFFSLVQYCI